MSSGVTLERRVAPKRGSTDSSRSRRYVWTVVGDSDIDAFSHVSAHSRTSI